MREIDWVCEMARVSSDATRRICKGQRVESNGAGGCYGDEVCVRLLHAASDHRRRDLVWIVRYFQAIAALSLVFATEPLT